MAGIGDERVVIRIDVKADTTAIDRVRAKLTALCKQADDCSETFKKLGNALDDAADDNDRFGKRTRDGDRDLKRFSKTAKGFAKFMSTTFKLAMIGSAIETGLLMIALSSVNGLLATGRFLVRTYHVAMSALAKSAAAAGVALATVAAAQRQYAAAMSSGRYGGSFELSSRGLRTMTADARLASLGIKSLNAAFATASKNARVTGGTVSAIGGLMDFATLSGDLEKGTQAVANLVSLVQNGGAGGEGVAAAAKEIGPEFEKAFKKVSKGGKATKQELLKAFSSGELAESAGIAGSYENVQGSLLGQGKAFLTQMINLFADLGNRFIEPMQRAFAEISRGLVVTTTKLMPLLDNFGRGKMIPAIVKGIDKLSEFLVKLMREYVPTTQNFFQKMSSFWNKLVNGFKRFGAYLNQFKESSAIMNKFFGKILGAFGSELKQNFEDFADGVLKNEDNFLKFADAIGDLVRDILKLFRSFRNAFFEALPAITRITNVIGALVDTIAMLISGLSRLKLPFLGDMGGLMGLLAYAGPMIGLKMGTSYMGKSPAERRRSKARRGRRMNALKRGGQKGYQFLANNPGVLGIAGGIGVNYLTDMGPSWLESIGDVASLAMIGGGAGHLIAGGTGMGVGALALGGAAAIHQGSKWASEGVYRATKNKAASTAVGAGTGMATGAAVGAALTAFGGPTALVGAAIGAVVGGLWGAFQGWRQDGKFKEKARAAAKTFVDAYAESVEQAFAGNNIKAVRYAMSQFDTYAQQMADTQVKSGTAMTEAQKLWVEQTKKYEPTLKLVEARFSELTRVTGMSEDQIMDLANTADIDLSNALLSLQDIMEATGIATRRVGEDLNEFMTDIYAEGVGSLQKAVDALKAPQAINEASRALREAALEGTLTPEVMAGGLQTIMQQQLLLSGGDPIAAYKQLLLDLGAPGTKGGGQFNTPGNIFYGVRDAFTEAEFGMFRDLAFGTIGEGIAGTTAENLISSAAGAGASFGVSKEALTAILSDMDPMALIALAEKFQGGFGFSPVVGKGSREIGARSMESQLTGIGLSEEIIKLIKPDLSEEAKVRENTNNFGAHVQGFKLSGVDPFVGAVEDFAAAVEKFAGGDGGDTSSPRRNIVDTLGAHGKLDMMISGKRSVTSGYRTWNLGSMSSDHAAGRAYDLVGQNLGLYQMAARANGGYAEFHGGSSNRHLHVVPNTADHIGDDSTPVMKPVATASTSGSTITNNFVINQQPGQSAEALAAQIMDYIDRSQKSLNERY